MASENIIIIKKDNLSQLLTEAELPLLVDFWASWCGPCKAIAPIIDELAEEFKGRFLVGKSNVDDEGVLAQDFNIMSIPTMIVFKSGKEVERIVGARSKNDLRSIMEKYL